MLRGYKGRRASLGPVLTTSIISYLLIGYPTALPNCDDYDHLAQLSNSTGSRYVTLFLRFIFPAPLYLRH